LLKIAFEIILGPKERERRQKTMTTINEKTEFNPQRDILGKTIAKNRTNCHYMVGLKGL
jgi:hypothetical protein